MGDARTTPARGQAAHPVDVHVGAKVRARRRALGVSQQGLAEHCGLSFQQIQKYERGVNRISCSMLVMISRALLTPPGYFVDDAPGAENARPAHDGWADAQRIIGMVPGAIEALYCLDALPGPKRVHLVAGLQMAAGRWPDDAPRAAAA